MKSLNSSTEAQKICLNTTISVLSHFEKNVSEEIAASGVFKPEIKREKYDREVKQIRSIFRNFKAFYGKGIYLNPRSDSNRERYLQKAQLSRFSLADSTLFSDQI